MVRRGALLCLVLLTGCYECWSGSGHPLTKEILDESLALGTRFLLANQKPEGNFTYEYDWKKKTFTPGDNQVRQAGAVWGLALIHHDAPSPEVARALERGLAFFERHSMRTPSGDRIIRYPGNAYGSTGTVALVALALIETLRNPGDIPVERLALYEARLAEYLGFLLRARMPNGQWHSSYGLPHGTPGGDPSPYFDGEALLALVKAAKYLGRDDLWPVVMESAEAGWQENVVKALEKDRDSNTTKGY